MPPIDLARTLWLKADEDIRLAALLVSNPEFSDEVFGFHLQQAIEKLLKSLLTARQKPFPFTHNLYELTDICGDHGIPLPDFVEELCFLTPFATKLRYASMPVGSAEVLNRADLLQKTREFHSHVARELRF